MIFADLHCHPTLYGFNRARNGPEETDPARFHPWHIPPSDAGAMAQGRRAAAYSQCDFAKCQLSGTRIVFASITPIEVGFFRGALEKEDNTSFMGEALRLASGQTALKGAVRLWQEGKQAALREFTGILRNDGPLRKMVQKKVLGYSKSRLDFMLSDTFDYWDEYLHEYDYLKAGDGIQGRATVEILEGGERVELQAEGRYHLVRGSSHLEEIMGKGEIATILSIEGAHVVSIGPDQERVDEAVIFERIEALKAQPHPIFFITLAHHFDNGLCGHAHSLPGSAELVIDQGRRMGEGFEEEDDLGRRAVRAFLDLDRGLNAKGGRRILIDGKHMSPRTRQQYYSEILDPANEKRAKAGLAPIPMIMSHTGYTGVETLDALIAHSAFEDDHWHRGSHNAWGINACDDDLRAIHRSQGLLGVIFDQRVLGVRNRQKIHPPMMPAVVIDQLLSMVDVIMLDDRIAEADKPGVWDCLCIGSDYDGLIDPLSCYPTVLSLPRFAEDLRVQLQRVAHTRHIEAIGVDNLVEKICWRNAHDFAIRHLPAATGDAL